MFRQKPKEPARPDADAGSQRGVARGYGSSCVLVCTDYEQRRVFEFCKVCGEQERITNLYLCMRAPRYREDIQLTNSRRVFLWADEMGTETPDDLLIQLVEHRKHIWHFY